MQDFIPPYFVVFSKHFKLNKFSQAICEFNKIKMPFANRYIQQLALPHSFRCKSLNIKYCEEQDPSGILPCLYDLKFTHGIINWGLQTFFTSSFSCSFCFHFFSLLSGWVCRSILKVNISWQKQSSTFKLKL